MKKYFGPRQFPIGPRFASLLTFFITWIGSAAAIAQDKPRTVHVFVALADNAHQGIVPVPASLGNGDDAGRNLYWGAAFGVRTYFKKTGEWKELSHLTNVSSYVLERSIFYNPTGNTYLIADAYRGREIKQAITDFFEMTARVHQDQAAATLVTGPDGKTIELNPWSELTVYVGHDGLMDFSMDRIFRGDTKSNRQAIVLACASKIYFGPNLRSTGGQPLLWTTGLMAPEAYTLKAALDGWMAGDSGEQIRQRAAKIYAQYQKINLGAAQRLFSSGW